MNREHTQVQRRVNRLLEEGKVRESWEAARRWNEKHPGADLEPQEREPAEVDTDGVDPRRLRRIRPEYRPRNLPEPQERERRGGLGGARLRLR